MSTKEEINKFQTEHLFLLIGGNPLPNYVSANLMTKPKEDAIEDEDRRPTIHLVFSEATKSYAGYLRAVLGEKNYCLKDLPVNPARQLNIYNSIQSRVSQLLSNGVTSIGLNYTGGTKAMAVHTYRAVKNTCGDKIKPCFSYLDSREMKMCVDRENNEDRVEFKLDDPKETHFKDAEISLDDLLKLHGKKLMLFRNEANPRARVRFPHVLDSIYDEFSTNYDNWKVLRKTRNFSLVPRLKTTLMELGLLENGDLASNAVLKEKGFHGLGNYVFGGDWLEDFVLKKILEIKQESSLGDCGSGLKIERADRSFDFEVDGVCLRSYQFFVATCSCSGEGGESKALYKGKIFEALWRAKQLGGDEAKAGLFCLASDCFMNDRGETTDFVSLLNNELNDPHVTIFGKEILQDSQAFTRKLKGWFENR